MKNIDVVQILICILSSSFLSVIVSAIFLDPIRERRKYIFDEKKRVYDSIIVFAQIFLYPKEAKFSLGVERMQCPIALLSPSGATTYTSAIVEISSASALSPFAFIPSSFANKIFS